MRTHKIKVTIPPDHHIAVSVPDDFPEGPAEVIVLADAPARRIVKLAGVLADPTMQPTHRDPIADSLQEFRKERQARLDRLGPDVSSPKDS